MRQVRVLHRSNICEHLEPVGVDTNTQRDLSKRFESIELLRILFEVDALQWKFSLNAFRCRKTFKFSLGH